MDKYVVKLLYELNYAIQINKINDTVINSSMSVPCINLSCVKIVDVNGRLVEVRCFKRMAFGPVRQREAKADETFRSSFSLQLSSNFFHNRWSQVGDEYFVPFPIFV